MSGVAARAAGVRVVVDREVGATASTALGHERGTSFVICHSLISLG